MQNNYSKLSLAKLRQEKTRIDKAIAAHEAREMKVAMAKVAAVAKEAGLDLSELSASDLKGQKRSSGKRAGTSSGARKKTSKDRRAKVAPKYRNPDDPSTTWTGRGRKPVWVREFLDNGGALESITIQ